MIVETTMKSLDLEEELKIAAALGLRNRATAEPRRAVEMAPAAAPPVVRKRKGPRKPVYVDGVRLGRLALWT